MRKMITILAILAVCGLASAVGSDTRFTADGGMSVRGYTAVDVVADGTATITLIDSSTSTVKKTYYVRDSLPRVFSWANPGSAIDSLYVDVDTASEVIVTPR